jgi:hypothetical protein
MAGELDVPLPRMKFVRFIVAKKALARLATLLLPLSRRSQAALGKSPVAKKQVRRTISA